MKEQLKTMIKAELLKEAGISAEYDGIFGKQNVDLESDIHRYNFGNSHMDEGRVYAGNAQMRPVDWFNTGALGTALVGAIAANRLRNRTASNLAGAASILGLIGGIGGASVGRALPQEYSDSEDVTDELADIGYSNFKHR